MTGLESGEDEVMIWFVDNAMIDGCVRPMAETEKGQIVRNTFEHRCQS